MNKSKRPGTYFAPIVLGLFLTALAPMSHAIDGPCARERQPILVKFDHEGCVLTPPGHSMVVCEVSNLQQNSWVSISSTNFIPDTDYPLPTEAIYLDHNAQQIVFSGAGIGVDENGNPTGGQIVFQYFGPWLAPWRTGYQFYISCIWT